MTNEPTQEQIKEFWEWCGFAQLEWAKAGWHYEQTKKVMNWTHPLMEYGSLEFLPRIDLNNLFKYAVPRAVFEMTRKWKRSNALDILFANWLHEWKLNHKDPALALFWALYPILKEASK